MLLYKRLNKKETIKAVNGIVKFFNKNRRKKICNAELNGFFLKVPKGDKRSIFDFVTNKIGYKK